MSLVFKMIFKKFKGPYSNLYDNSMVVFIPAGEKHAHLAFSEVGWITPKSWL